MERRDLSKMLIGAATTGVLLSPRSEAQTCTLPCYPQTPTELAAGVTPADLSYTSSPLDVRRLGAVGDNSTNNAVAFANAKAIAAASSTPVEIVFPAGTYRTSTGQNWFVPGITLRALGTVVIRSTATSGSVVIFDAGSSTNGYRCRMEGEFVLDALNQGVQYGLYTRNVHHSKFECSVRNVVSAGCRVDGAVLSSYRITVTDVTAPMTVATPVNGIYLDSSPANTSTTDCTFDLIIETSTSDGVVLAKASNNIFRGTSEGVGGKGVSISADSGGNLFHAFFMEANVAGDVDCYGKGNRFVNCFASSRASSAPYEAVKSIVFRNASERNAWEGGLFYAASVESGALNSVFQDFDSLFAVLDSGTNTWIYGKQFNLSTATRAAQIPVQESWTNLITVNSWDNTSSTYQRLQYTINRSSREILLRGEVGLGAVGTTITTLPAGYRPSKQFAFHCPSNTTQNYAVVSVLPTGEVKHVAGYTSSIDLGAVRFFLG